MLWVWVRAFGDGPLSVRLPWIMLGVSRCPPCSRHADIFAVVDRAGSGRVRGGRPSDGLVQPGSPDVLAVHAVHRLGGLGTGQGGPVEQPRAWFATHRSAALVWTQYFSVLVVLTQQLVLLAW